ncbi:MAG: dihydroneopterin aldolase [Actinomycetes bacterium]
MSDTLALRGLRVRGYHGVLPEERQDGQVFVVDAVLHVETRRAAASDDLHQTVDYAVLANRLAAIVGGEPVNLIETLADRLASCCLEDERVERVELTVHKPDAPVEWDVDDVTVTVERTRP